MSRADRIVKEKRLFLKKGFSRDDLAAELGTNRTYLGEAMSTCRNCRWHEYINSFRMDYFLKTAGLAENRRVSIEDLASQCGFGSANTLNYYLKRDYGTTANAYRKNLSTALRAEGRAKTATLS